MFSDARVKFSRSFWFGLILLAGLNLSLALLVPSGPTSLDVACTHFAQSFSGPAVDTFFRAVTSVGSGFLPLLWVALLAVLFFHFGWRREMRLLLIGTGSEVALNRLMKMLVNRPRPSGDQVRLISTEISPSFPSGHAAFAALFLGFAILVLVRRRGARSRLVSLLVGVLGLLILAIGLSRVYLGVHWLSDVLGGFLLGGSILAGLYYFYDEV